MCRSHNNFSSIPINTIIKTCVEFDITSTFRCSTDFYLKLQISIYHKQQACVQPDTAAVNVTLLASAAVRRCCWAPGADYRYLLPVRRPAANARHAAASIDRRDRQTDGHPTVTQTLRRILGEHVNSDGTFFQWNQQCFCQVQCGLTNVWIIHVTFRVVFFIHNAEEPRIFLGV